MREREEEEEKKYLFIKESFAFILTTGQGSPTMKKRNKERRNFYFRPRLDPTLNLTSVIGTRRKDSRSLAPFFFPFLFFFFFFPCEITLSFLLIFLSGRYSPSVCTSFRINRYFYFAPIRMAGARLPRFLVHLGN